jgi:hypothetical protein
MKEALKLINACYKGASIQRFNKATQQWIDVDLARYQLTDIMTEINNLRIKPDSFKKELFVSSQQSIGKTSVTNYLPKIAVPNEGRYKITIEVI